MASNPENRAPIIWGDDLLDRSKEGRLVIDFLIRRSAEKSAAGGNSSYVLNLDAPWGQGKTFFLTRLSKQLESEGYTALLINAWQSDFADDPLIPVIAALDEKFSAQKNKSAQKILGTIRRHGAEIIVRAGKHGAATLGRKYLGPKFTEELSTILGHDAAAAAQDAGENLASDLLDKYSQALLDEFNRSRDSIAKFRTSLCALAASAKTKPPIFIMIDELDRCRPSYAIALLERMKHLFDVPGVIFVLATDARQLSHAVRSIYGDRFDAERYLLRFFDRAYTFATPDRRQFITHLFKMHAIAEEELSSPPANNHVGLFDQLSASFGLTLRDIEQSFDIFRNFVTLWPPRTTSIELIYLLPLIFAYQVRDLALFDALSNLALPATPTIRGEPIRDFNILFNRIDEWGRPKRKEIFSFLELLRRMLEVGRTPLPDIARSDRFDWIFDRFMDEQRKRFSGGWRTHQPPKSLLLEYADQVRAVGRFGSEQS